MHNSGTCSFMSGLRRPVLTLFATTAFALAATADYQFIRTAGWDAETASQAKSSALASDGMDLEARYRTWLESDGTDLVTTEFVGTFIIIR